MPNRGSNPVNTVTTIPGGTQPVSGTVTANQGTGTTLANKWPVQLTDGTNTVNVDNNGHLSVAFTEQLTTNVYTESPTSRLTSGTSSTGFWPNDIHQAFIGVNVTAISGGTSPAVTVSLQQQDANGIYQTIGTSSSISSVSAAAFSVGTGMTSGAMLVTGSGQYRLSWTVTGSPSVLTFQIGISAR